MTKRLGIHPGNHNRAKVVRALKKNIVPSGGNGAPRNNGNHTTWGIYSDLSNRNLDQRCKLARALRSVKADLIESLTGDPSPQQRILIDRVVYKLARVTLFEAATLAGDKANDEHYLAWANSLRQDLLSLGLERRAPDLQQDLQSYLRGKTTVERTRTAKKPQGVVEATKSALRATSREIRATGEELASHEMEWSEDYRSRRDDEAAGRGVVPVSEAPASVEAQAGVEVSEAGPPVEVEAGNWRCLRCGEVVWSLGPPVKCPRCKRHAFKREAA